VDTAADERGHARVDLGHHRQHQGGHALPPGRAGDRRHLLGPPDQAGPGPTVFTGTPPLGFTYGLGGLLLFPLRAGASTLLSSGPRRPSWRRDRGARGDRAVHRAHRLPGHAGRGQGLRAEEPARCVSAGEHLPKSVWEEFRQATGIAIIDGIGSTEMLHVFISAADGDIRPGSTGRAVPGYRAKILDEHGQEVPDGEPGWLAVQGPTGCRYLSDERQRTYVQHG